MPGNATFMGVFTPWSCEESLGRVTQSDLLNIPFNSIHSNICSKQVGRRLLLDNLPCGKAKIVACFVAILEINLTAIASVATSDHEMTKNKCYGVL